MGRIDFSGRCLVSNNLLSPEHVDSGVLTSTVFIAKRQSWWIPYTLNPNKPKYTIYFHHFLRVFFF